MKPSKGMPDIELSCTDRPNEANKQHPFAGARLRIYAETSFR
jgi:hypothetical protein